MGTMDRFNVSASKLEKCVANSVTHPGHCGGGPWSGRRFPGWQTLQKIGAGLVVLVKDPEAVRPQEIDAQPVLRVDMPEELDELLRAYTRSCRSSG